MTGRRLEKKVDYTERYQIWMESVPQDSPLHQELEGLKDNEKEKKERFFQDLKFGTAGLRGIVGAGTNCMNEYTVGRATQGIADYIRNRGKEAMKVKSC